MCVCVCARITCLCVCVPCSRGHRVWGFVFCVRARSSLCVTLCVRALLRACVFVSARLRFQKILPLDSLSMHTSDAAPSAEHFSSCGGAKQF